MTVADDLATSVREALGYLNDAYTWEAVKALDSLIERAEAAEAEVARLRDGLRRIVENAEAWHGPEDAQPDAKHRALGVIAQWGRALLAEDGAA